MTLKKAIPPWASTPSGHPFFERGHRGPNQGGDQAWVERRRQWVKELGWHLGPGMISAKLVSWPPLRGTTLAYSKEVRTGGWGRGEEILLLNRNNGLRKPAGGKNEACESSRPPFLPVPLSRVPHSTILAHVAAAADSAPRARRRHSSFPHPLPMVSRSLRKHEKAILGVCMKVPLLGDALWLCIGHGVFSAVWHSCGTNSTRRSFLECCLHWCGTEIMISGSTKEMSIKKRVPRICRLQILPRIRRERASPLGCRKKLAEHRRSHSEGHHHWYIIPYVMWWSRHTWWITLHTIGVSLHDIYIYIYIYDI